MDTPSHWIQHVVDETKAKVLITAEQFRSRFTSIGIPTLTVDQASFTEGSQFGATELPSLSDEAYVMFTSGSTGRPKGVMVPHHALAEYVDWAASVYAPTNDLAFAFYSPITFDLTLTSLFTPLISGGYIVAYPESTSKVDLTIHDVVQDDAVDVIKLTPSHLAILDAKRLRSNRRLKCMIVGGEDLKVDLARQVDEVFDHRVTIFNEYGPTEATVACMIHRYDRDRDVTGSVPIGQPAPNRRVYVLDAHLNPTPMGTPGELFIGGAGLADGYLNQLTETAARFLPDPFVQGGTMYRTGDRARFCRPGQIEFLDRLDDQVKVNGVRIELTAVESAVRSHPNIQSAVASVAQPEFHARPRVDTASPNTIEHCVECGIESSVPGTHLDVSGRCQHCIDFEDYADRVADYFQTPDALHSEITKSRNTASATSTPDCLMLLSGGKDSTYALCQLVDMGLRVVAATLDNGYISPAAMDNIRRTVQALEVPHVTLSTHHMNDIFVDSLQRHSNVCHGCFKTIYTLAIQYADEHNIPVIVTGLSRGQLFETRLTKELFQNDTFDNQQIDGFVVEARKAYHRVDDAVARLLDVRSLQGDDIFERVRIVDFYRYYDVPLEEMLTYLGKRVPWVRPADTGRSTNCLINDVGIYVHRRTQGYHNYAVPYSWDVRLGHKNATKRSRSLMTTSTRSAFSRSSKRLGSRKQRRKTPHHPIVWLCTSSRGNRPVQPK